MEEQDAAVPVGPDDPQIEVLLFWDGGPPVPLIFPVDLARAYIDAACGAPGEDMPDLGDLTDPDDVALGLGYAFNAVTRAGRPILGFDPGGLWVFQPGSYRGIRITRPDQKPPSAELMRRSIGFRPPATSGRTSSAQAVRGRTDSTAGAGAPEGE